MQPAASDLPQTFTVEWVADMQQTLLDSTQNGIGGLSAVLSAAKICSILDALGKILKSESTVKEVQFSTDASQTKYSTRITTSLNELERLLLYLTSLQAEAWRNNE